VHRLLTHVITRVGGRRGVAGTLSTAQLDQRRSARSQSPSTAVVHGLGEIAEHSSRRERMAMQAEREMAKLYVAIFMKDRIGEEFEGVISHITKFGFFVELKEFFVEGVVRLTSLKDDNYRFDEQGLKLVSKRSKKIISIGDEVRIRVENVSIADREVDFELLDLLSYKHLS